MNRQSLPHDKNTVLAARGLGGLDNENVKNEWIVFDKNNHTNWFLTNVNKEFALELVARWNTISNLLSK